MNPKEFPVGSQHIASADIETSPTVTDLLEVYDATNQNERKALNLSNLFETPPAMTATITVSAEGATVANQRDITIQLKDAAGNELTRVAFVWAAVMTTAAAVAFSNGGSTGLAIGTDGALLAVVAKKLFLLTSEADGDIDLTYTDTGTDAAFLVLLTMNGHFIASAALTNA